ncbi:ankyrin repeat protein, putative [Trichomonas vaginalis G3]|uniref:Ankyrin repeat protein, putative n=1 Tax=Trichomonas vaginalis (strain ATCC PRA-98 / G3) TaxID=412133 RepID=A2DYL2_TRIV3|nr:ankyrin repeat protein, putative [Trichomonas vaginalis G3]|eukprot:XP_001326770.1 ankyrin repeat protein [Trichomonas vaginalis G3]
MYYAIISHHLDIVILLYNEYHLPIDLEDCCRYHNLPAFLYYLDQTRDIDLCFVISPHLYLNGARIDATQNLRTTALHNACSEKLLELVSFLILHGADVNCRDYTYLTPLHYAAMNNDIDMENFLLSHGADPELWDDRGLLYKHYHRSERQEETNLEEDSISENSKNGFFFSFLTSFLYYLIS